MGLVGESGCGKTTIGRLLTRVIKADSGKVLFEGRDTLLMDRLAFRDIQKNIQMVFQDPQASLNPRMTVKDIVGEPLMIHRGVRGIELREKVQVLLKRVGLNPDHMYRFPHEFSGGQRQRIVIARALALSPTSPDWEAAMRFRSPVTAADNAMSAAVVRVGSKKL